MFCREQAARFNERLAEIRGMGAEVVAIGNGTALMAKDFVERFDVRFDVYTDPSKRSYDAAGMVRGLNISTSGLRSAWRALKGGHIQGRTRGDAMQQGGIVIVDADGEAIFAHADGEAGDHADIGQIVETLRRAAAPASA